MRSLCHARVCLLSVLIAVPAASQRMVDLPEDDRDVSMRLEALYTVGAVDGADWEAFEALSDAAFGANGRLYLLDRDGARVVVVDGDGRLLHSLGSEGPGPGEYRAPAGIVVLSDGRVVVWDATKRTLLLYAEDAAFLDEFRPMYEAGVPDGPLILSPDGFLIGLPLQMITGWLGRAYITGSGFEMADGEMPLLRTPVEAGAPVEILTRVAVGRWEGSGRAPVIRAFEQEPSFGLLPDGRVAVHDSDRYRIEIREPGGSLDMILRRPIEPRPTTEADRRAFRRAWAAEAHRPRTLGLGGGTGGRRPEP